MYPTLYTFGSLEFYSYTVMLAIAVLIGVFFTIWKNEALEKPYPITTIGGIWVFLGGLLGARVWWILQYDSPWGLHKALVVWQGGLVYYGGLIGGVVGGLLYLKYCQVPILRVGDLILPQVPLAHAVARFGCFLNGCCWGTLSDGIWGVSFPKGSSLYDQQVLLGIIEPDASHAAAVHPTQLYEMAGLILVFIVMRYLSNKPHPPGGILFLYPLLYGAMRFGVEVFRGDTERPYYGMTISQGVSVGMVLGAAVVLVILWYQYLKANHFETVLDDKTEKN